MTRPIRIAIAAGVVLLATAGVIAIIMTVPAANPGANAPAAAGAPHFVEQAAAAGIEHRYDGEFMFFVGGGVAVFGVLAKCWPISSTISAMP